MKKNQSIPAIKIHHLSESESGIAIDPDKNLDNFEISEDVPAYDWLPRPYTKHDPDIERRRSKRMQEMMTSADDDLQIEEYDKRVNFSPAGLLIFHVLELFNLSVNSTKWRENPNNRFTVELWSFQDPEYHFIVGTVDFHVYEFIRQTHAIETHEIWSDGIKMGSICIEYCFAYGFMGYGHSNQFRNPKNPIMETICHSMYPRIKLEGDDELDKVYRARLPKQLKVFSYNSLILEMDRNFLAYMNEHTNTNASEAAKSGVRLDKLEAKPMMMQQVHFEGGKPVHCKIHMNIHQKPLQAEFNDLYGEYICIGGRKNRLEYLSNLTQGRMRDIREKEAGDLFLPFKDKEAHKILVTDMNHPGTLLTYKKPPCPKAEKDPNAPENKPKVEDTAESERILDLFPAVRRETGFLGILFGYEKKPKPSMYINDMDYPLYKEALSRWKGPGGCCRTCRWMFLRIAAFFNWLYNFIFPEVKSPPKVPEISVTLASPEGSTTDVYTYFVKEQKEVVQTKTEKLQSQVTNFMESVDNPIYSDSDDANSLSSSEGDRQEVASRNYKD